MYDNKGGFMNQHTILIPTSLNKIVINTLLEFSESSDNLIIIIPGTGPVDQDGNISGFKTNIYKDISKSIHELNISTLRYDKPGVGKSSGNYNQIGLWDLVETVSDIVNYFRKTENYKFKKIILLGHSEGTIIATLVSKRIEVDGLILLGGAGSNLKSIMNVQNIKLYKEISNIKGLMGIILRLLITEDKLKGKQDKLFKKVELSSEDFFKISGQTIQAKWLREHFEVRELTIQNILKEISIPTLIINGDKDVQIDTEVINKLVSLNNPALTISVVKDMNHLLKIQKEKISLIKLKKIYKSLHKESISKELLSHIGEWFININKVEASNV